jgi:hypothetical protein
MNTSSIREIIRQAIKEIGMPAPMVSPIMKDDRKGLGYGTDAGRHRPRQSTSHYPYLDPDNYSEPNDDYPIDPEDIDAFLNKMTAYDSDADPYSIKKTDPFYFVGAATKLSDCFERPDTVLYEVEVMSNSMSPIPQLHPRRRRTGSTGSATGASAPHGYPSFTSRHGSKRGWSSAPKHDVEDQDFGINSLKDLLSDDELAVLLSQMSVHDVHNDQEKKLG